MAKILCIMGESGSGKTTSMRNLNPQTTYYVDCDKKGLSWRGWKKLYNAENKNYTATDDPIKVMRILEMIDKRAPHIKTLVIDTLNGIMVADEMRRIKEKGYDKWTDLAACVYYIIDTALTLRDDLAVVFTAHVQTDDNGFTQIKTNGKKLNKIGLESKFPLVLLSKCSDGRYIFETNANSSTAKTPMGLFDEKVIDNDISAVIDCWNEYEN